MSPSSGPPQALAVAVGERAACSITAARTCTSRSVEGSDTIDIALLRWDADEWREAHGLGLREVPLCGYGERCWGSWHCLR